MANPPPPGKPGADPLPAPGRSRAASGQAEEAAPALPERLLHLEVACRIERLRQPAEGIDAVQLARLAAAPLLSDGTGQAGPGLGLPGPGLPLGAPPAGTG